VVTPRPVRPRSAYRILPARPFAAAATMLLFTFLLYVIEVYDSATGQALDREDGIIPRETDHLTGVLFAPLLHAGWPHLEGNTPFFLILGFLAMAGGLGQWVAVTALVWVVSGLGVWFLAPDGTITVGSSGVIFGWLVFLLFRGFFVGSLKQILLAVVLFFFWGGMLLGVLPGQPEVSWQAHLFGAIGGLLAARMVGTADRRPAYQDEVPEPPR
jgi:membrane associated rhomboid family serine protease